MREEINKTLKLHKKWLNEEKGGIRADLSRANLSEADLSRADLSGANLSIADLSGANLSGSDLFVVNLSRADLSAANLSGANLSGVNLSGTIYENKEFKSFQYNQHLAFWDGYTLRIQCENHSLDYWLENYEKIGKQNNYSKQEIEKYGEFIKSLKEEV